MYIPCGNCFYIGITFDLDQKKLQKIMKFENYKNAHCSKTSQIILNRWNRKYLIRLIEIFLNVSYFYENFCLNFQQQKI